MKLKHLATICALAVHSANTFAHLPDLIDVYQQALANDAVFKKAYSDYMATKENLPQALSSLLPNISLQGNIGYYNVQNASGIIVTIGSSSFNYRQRSYTLSVTQPILNWPLWKSLSQASYVVKQALAAYDDAAQDLIIRTSTSYFSVLQAEDNLKFTKSQLRANGRSLDQAKQRFKVGLDAITSVYEAQAAYDSSRSLVIAAQNNLTNQYESLRLLTNHTYSNLAPLKRTHVPLVRPEPQNIDKWTQTAIQQNFSLKSAQFAVLAAKEKIEVENSGHLPTLSFNASYNKTDNNASNSFVNVNRQTGIAQFDLKFPIYQGGLVVSKTRQAAYNHQSAQETFESSYRSMIVNTRVAYNTIIDGISRIQADRQAVKSAQNSLDSTDAQFKVGTRTMVDVVTSQKNLFQAQTQLASDQYSYIVASLNLKYLAGTLSVSDLQEINHWLRTNRAYGKPTKQRIQRHHISKTTKSSA